MLESTSGRHARYRKECVGKDHVHCDYYLDADSARKGRRNKRMRTSRHYYGDPCQEEVFGGPERIDPHFEEDGEVLVGPDGSMYMELTGWLEPNEVRCVVARGVLLAIDWCADSWEWDAQLSEAVMQRLVRGPKDSGQRGLLLVMPPCSAGTTRILPRWGFDSQFRSGV